MKGYLHVICKNLNKEYIKTQIVLFSSWCYAELSHITEKIYWKEESCIEFCVELNFKQYDLKKIEKGVERFFSELDDLIYTDEQQENIEIAIYSSISEILQNNKVFFVMYVDKV